MASSWGRLSWCALVIVVGLPLRWAGEEAMAGLAPIVETAPPDPEAVCASVEQGEMVHVFDTRAMPGPATYVNDHTLVQAKDGSWHLFGIFHREPIGEDSEIEFVHAVASEPEPALWSEGAFVPAPEPFTIALRADRSKGETHLWAPHVVEVDGRWVMVYQGGGPNDEHASIRIAESDDLYRWTRIGDVPLFEDFCAARDPMLVRRDDTWMLFYTRCDSTERRLSGVAFRSSRDLVQWTQPHMAAVLASRPATWNSAFSESPFVFERDGWHYLSVTSYPLGWDATIVYRSRAPYAFPDAPFTVVRGHAAEWLFDGSGRAFVTHAGPGQRGVWLSRVSGI